MDLFLPAVDGGLRPWPVRLSSVAWHMDCPDPRSSTGKPTRPCLENDMMVKAEVRLNALPHFSRLQEPCSLSKGR